MEGQDGGETGNNFRGRTWGAELEKEPGCWSTGIFTASLSFQARRVHRLWPFCERGPRPLTAFSGVVAARVHGLITIQTPELENREPCSYSSMRLLIQKLTKTTLTSRQLVIRCSREPIQSCTHTRAETLISLEAPSTRLPVWLCVTALPFIQSIFTTLFSDNPLCLLAQPYLEHGAGSVILAL